MKKYKYQVKVGTGRYLNNGAAERISVYANTRAELNRKVADINVKIRTGDYKTPSDVTVEEYSIKWLNTYKENKSKNTIAMYKNIIDKHIIPDIGFIRLNDLKRTDIQSMINNRKEKAETCKKLVLTLKQIEKEALIDKIIKDPFMVKLEIPRKHDSVKRALTENEKKALNQADFLEQDKIYVFLLYGTGIRRGEALALSPKDIDSKKQTVTIDKTLIFVGNASEIKDCPKSESGFRTIPIPDAIWDIIHFYVAKKKKEKSEYLFTMKNGKLITQSSYVKMWNRIVRTMQMVTDEPIDGLTAHIFRHNYATLLYYSGISELKAVELMGHTDGKMIREVYAHLDESKENTVEKLNKIIAL